MLNLCASNKNIFNVFRLVNNESVPDSYDANNGLL